MGLCKGGDRAGNNRLCARAGAFAEDAVHCARASTDPLLLTGAEDRDSLGSSHPVSTQAHAAGPCPATATATAKAKAILGNLGFTWRTLAAPPAAPCRRSRPLASGLCKWVPAHDGAQRASSNVPASMLANQRFTVCTWKESF